jgi:hypothetical protein
MNCHCSNCRRATGSAVKPLAGIERGKLTVAEGGDKLLMHGDDAVNDTHCCAVRCFIQSSGAALSCTSPWERSSTIRRYVLPGTSRRLQGAVVHHHR